MRSQTRTSSGDRNDCLPIPEGLAAMAAAVGASDQARREEHFRRFVKAFGATRAFSIANANRIVSILAPLAHAVMPEISARPWLKEKSATEARILSYLDELDRVALAMQDEAIPLVALKNVGIARALHSEPGECPMGDLDVLVRRRDFRRAHQLILGLGYEFKFRSDIEEEDLDEAEAGGGGEYRIELEGIGTLWVEIQWRPIAGRWLRPDQEPTADEFIDRSVEVPGSKVRILAPEDNLLQVALHTAKHSYVRAPGFRLHTDVDRIVRRCAIDWDRFVEDVQRRRVKTPVYFSLWLASELLCTPVPANVLARLRPGRLKCWLIVRWLLRVGLFDPDEPKFGRLGYPVFTSLQYDSWAGVARAMFPPRSWMQDRYNFRGGWKLPYFYARRWGDLAFRRSI